MKYLVAAVFLCALSTNARAMTGNDILRECEPGVEKSTLSVSENMDYVHCLGYLAGVTETHAFLMTRFKSENKTAWEICGPSDGIPGSQAARVVVKWLKNNPEKLHHGGGILVIMALHEAFPCK